MLHFRGNNSDDCFDNDGLQSDDGNEDDDDDDEFDQDDDDANPFAAGNSDDEGCPWLKKKSAASKLSLPSKPALFQTANRF